MMDALNCKVVRLIRVSIGPLRLEKLRSGEYRNLESWEVEKLKKAVALS
jgi:16S rRNA U516 pseudouridylate synthase RsuA-like enzyme